MSRGQEPALFERLLGTGVRPTKQRLLVLETLAAEPHDATAQEIHARLRDQGEKVGLATVYRALAGLQERDVVDELADRTGESAWRLSRPTRGRAGREAASAPARAGRVGARSQGGATGARRGARAARPS